MGSRRERNHQGSSFNPYRVSDRCSTRMQRSQDEYGSVADSSTFDRPQLNSCGSTGRGNSQDLYNHALDSSLSRPSYSSRGRDAFQNVYNPALKSSLSRPSYSSRGRDASQNAYNPALKSSLSRPSYSSRGRDASQNAYNPAHESSLNRPSYSSRDRNESQNAYNPTFDSLFDGPSFTSRDMEKSQNDNPALDSLFDRPSYISRGRDASRNTYNHNPAHVSSVSRPSHSFSDRNLAGTPEVSAPKTAQNEAVHLGEASTSAPVATMECDLGTLTKVDEDTLLGSATPDLTNSLADATEQLEGLIVKRRNLSTSERRKAIQAKLSERGIAWDPKKWKRGQSRKKPVAGASATPGSTPQAENTLKRPRGTSATPLSAEGPRKKVRGEGNQARPAADKRGAGERGSYRDSLTVIKIAIVPEAFPEVKLTVEQGEQVEFGLIDSFQLMEDGTYPSFLGTYIEKGALIVSCFNDTTAQWLISIMEGFRPLGDDFKLRSGPRKEILKATQVFFRAPQKLQSPERILDMLNKQNPTLKAKEWTILSKKPDPKGYCFVCLVDDACLASIEAVKRRAFVGLWQVTLVIMAGDSNKGNVGESTVTSSEVAGPSTRVVAENNDEGSPSQPPP